LGRSCPLIQGCSTLDCDEFCHPVDASERRSVSILADRAGRVCLEDIEGETSHAGENAWIAADTRAVFAEGDVAGVVGGSFDPPMLADRLGGLGGGERLVGDVERGFACFVQQSGSDGAGVDETLDPNDGPDVRFPVTPVEVFTRFEDGDGSAFEAAASVVILVVGTDRRRCGDDLRDGLFKRWLVALDLDDQGDTGFPGDIEMFFDNALHRA
jgi:hypothetical protein